MQVIEFWTSFLKRLPAWMGALPKLSTLRLNKVELQEWSFPGFKTLQALDLSRCNVTKVTPLGHVATTLRCFLGLETACHKIVRFFKKAS